MQRASSRQVCPCSSSGVEPMGTSEAPEGFAETPMGTRKTREGGYNSARKAQDPVEPQNPGDGNFGFADRCRPCSVFCAWSVANVQCAGAAAPGRSSTGGKERDGKAASKPEWVGICCCPDMDFSGLSQIESPDYGVCPFPECIARQSAELPVDILGCSRNPHAWWKSTPQTPRSPAEAVNHISGRAIVPPCTLHVLTRPCTRHVTGPSVIPRF
jgi:hypothetical protein